eukprot:XP_011450424.1 PREDICTED: transgelin-2 isoform X10 [Crassostrea gigas]
MAERMKPMGMDRALSSKMGAKYDPQAEAEVRHWFKQLLNEDIGEGSMTVEKNLKDGILLIKLLQKLYEGTPNKPAACDKIKLKFNTSQAPFKQMENIELFLKGANAYGVPDNSLFQTVDLYEGRNMAMVIATILQVGTEAQRNGFQGETAGNKPVEKNVRDFSYAQLKSGHGTVGLQAGTNKLDSQKGMTAMGAVRHISDIRADKFDKTSEGVITLQAGTNQWASQKGMTAIGAVRHISDLKVSQACQEGQATISLQSGTNKFDSQKGTRGFGAVRHISDIRADDLLLEGTDKISPVISYTGGDSQKGMRGFGAQRHVSDIKITDLAEEYCKKTGFKPPKPVIQSETTEQTPVVTVDETE